MTHPHGQSPARHLATMREPLHAAGLSTILEREARRPLPTPHRRGPLPRYGFVIALVAAHDAETRLAATLDALDDQTRRPDAVVVVADRCSDATVVTALVHGATVVETSGNHHGCAGALNLALTEVLAMVDDDDVVLIVGDGEALAPTFVANGLAHLWATPPPARRRPARPAGVVVATPARTPNPRSAVGAQPLVGAGWPGGRVGGRSGATMVLARALTDVAATRPDPGSPDVQAQRTVLDPNAADPEAELLVALGKCGYRSVALDACRSTRTDGAPPSGRQVFGVRRRRQLGSLAALTGVGAGRPSRRHLAEQLRLATEITAPPLAAVSLATLAATGGPVLVFALVLAAAALLWLGERAWATRWAGRRLPGELAGGLYRASAAAVGVVAGTWQWLVGLRLRRGVWRHPTSGRILARRPAPFPTPPPLSLLRVAGSAIAIERSAPPADVRLEQWRRRGLGLCVVAPLLVTLIALPILLPLPAAFVLGGWAATVGTISVSRVLRAAWGKRTRN